MAQITAPGAAIPSTSLQSHPVWCAEHFAEIGVCEAAPIPVPGGEIRLCHSPDAGVFGSLYCKTEGLTVAEMKAIGYAILAMATRVEAGEESQ